MFDKCLKVLRFLPFFPKAKIGSGRPHSHWDPETEQTESMVPKNLMKRKLFRHHHPYKKSFLRIGE